MNNNIVFRQYKLENGHIQPEIHLSYRIFGQELGSAPIILVNHALTGNSIPEGENGWWQHYIGKNKALNTDFFTFIAFNIPGNGFENNPLIDNYLDFSTLDIAHIFWQGLDELKINELFAVIGGSLGGGIAWQMALLQPNRIEHLIPIATHWKANDWVVANTKLQAQILENSAQPLQDARTHAMLIYRNPASLKQKFSSKNQNFNVENWLDYHAEQLKNRFTLKAYKLMNHLLKSIGSNLDEKTFISQIQKVKSKIHLISIDSDLLFLANETFETYQLLKENKLDCSYFEIKSIHGHDAFLMPDSDFEKHLKSIFKPSFIPVL